ncbi:MAG: CotH kinase family protein [Candidatus Sumerlaeia bacterium]|nr:CotH kinase family protein [Candidatus Sumerlaeia bacterium]
MMLFKRACLIIAGVMTANMAHAVMINEYMASNGSTIHDSEGDAPDWIELFNPSSEPIDLEGHHLSNNPNNPARWKFPSVEIPAGGFLLVWASGKDRINGEELHTNFRISSAGAPLLLVGPDGKTILDQVDEAAVPRDVSRGRVPDGTGDFHFFHNPTPGAENDTPGYADILAPPEFSVQPGFYREPFELELNHPDPDVTLVYTTNGSIPTLEDTPYEGPILITDRTSEPNHFSSFVTSLFEYPHPYTHINPSHNLTKGTILRVTAFRDGYMESSTTTGTFFVFPEGRERYTLPVISLVTEKKGFFDEEEGIYVVGVRGNANNPAMGNYAQRGRDWERPTNFEYFDLDGELAVSQLVGARIHGGWSRRFPQKTLRLYARNGYGDSHIRHRFFEDREHDAFRRLLLRNSGNDWRLSMIRDATVHEVTRPMNVSTQAYTPTIVFLNGEYWGIHNIRERYDRHLLARRKGLDPDKVDILTANINVKAGERGHYDQLIMLASETDLADPANMAAIHELMDVENFINYNVTQIYHGNTDWPNNNIDYYRAQVPFDPTLPPGRDGRWRWLLYDVDRSFGYLSDPDRNTLQWATNRLNGNTNQEWPNRLLRSLLDNDQFRIDLVNAFADHLNSTFQPARVLSIIDAFSARIDPEIDEFHDRWWTTANHRGRWNRELEDMQEYAVERPAYLRQHIREYFDIDSDISLTISTNTALEGGRVRVNTLLLDPTVAGLGENIHPWTGTYFQGIPLTITAIPNQGYRFTGWQDMSSGKAGADLSDSKTLSITPDGDTHLLATFEAAETDRPMHYWSFNNGEDFLSPDYTTGGGHIEFDLADESEVTTGSGQGFSGETSLFGEPAGDHLRLNDPIGSTMTVRIPTTDFSDVQLAYESRRSGQGAGIQRVSYSLDGTAFSFLQENVMDNDDPQIYTMDFRSIPGTDDNESFAVRIHFEEGAGGTAGNNRFDNVTVTGTLIPGRDLPPLPLAPMPDRTLTAGISPMVIDLTEYFDFDASTEVSSSSNMPAVLTTGIDGQTLLLAGHSQGEATVTVSVDDLEAEFRVLVYPRPHVLAESPYTFTRWEADNPALSFPAGMIFLQSEVTDPGLMEPLTRDYNVPMEDTHPDDMETFGFPYNNTRRTRLSGLGDAGISFINTGRGRDLGGALVSLDTRGTISPTVSWVAGTVLENERIYAISLQYRILPSEEFVNIPGTVYLTAEMGDEVSFGPIPLPEETHNQQNVQLLWRYHHVEGEDGPRAKLRLDDIDIREGETQPTFWVLW